MPSKIVVAKAYSNGEIAYISWKLDGMISGCLGFEIARQYPDGDLPDAVLNTDWKPQDTSVWPVQKLT